VDDVYLRQKRKGITATRSVTEQLDLLLTLREFLEAWDSGTRAEMLEVAAPGFRQHLETLPEAFLQQAGRRMTGRSAKSGSSLKPEAQLDGGKAFVTLSRPGGSLVVSFEQHDDRGWLVTDLAVDSKDDAQKVSSFRKYAIALGAGLDFVAAYSDGNRERLETLCTPKFYRGTLAAADARAFPLPPPTPDLGGTDAQPVRLHRAGAEIVYAAENRLVKIGLVREGSSAGDSDEEAPAYRVEDVTLYDPGTRQETRLSAWHTAQALVQLFADAVAERDLKTLRHLSTHDLAKRVWAFVPDDRPEEIALAGLTPGDVQVVSTEFRGVVTEVVVAQGGAPVTYVLQDRGGELKVDDVLVAVPGRPGSMKTALTFVLPVRDLARTLRRLTDADQEQAAAIVARLEALSSADFDRLVWTQSGGVVPPTAPAASDFLELPPTSVIPAPDGTAVVRLGDDVRGAVVTFVTEQDRPVVEEIELIAGPRPDQRLSLRETLRSELALAQRRRKPPVDDDTRLAGQRGRGTVVPAGGFPATASQTPRDTIAPRAAIQAAHFEEAAAADDDVAATRSPSGRFVRRADDEPARLDPSGARPIAPPAPPRVRLDSTAPLPLDLGEMPLQ
jgi:hypothetical protein